MPDTVLKIDLFEILIQLWALKDADGMANSVDPDQTDPFGAVQSGSALFAQTYLFQY